MLLSDTCLPSDDPYETSPTTTAPIYWRGTVSGF